MREREKKSDCANTRRGNGMRKVLRLKREGGKSINAGNNEVFRELPAKGVTFAFISLFYSLSVLTHTAFEFPF